MKRIAPILILLMLSSFLYGNGGKPSTKTSASLHIIYKNHELKYKHKDSVLIIFDKYDGTGAGIIKQVYYPDHTHEIMIHDVPVGKYILIIRFVGFHSDTFVKTVRIGKAREKSLSVSLTDMEEFHSKNN